VSQLSLVRQDPEMAPAVEPPLPAEPPLALVPPLPSLTSSLPVQRSAGHGPGQPSPSHGSLSQAVAAMPTSNTESARTNAADETPFETGPRITSFSRYHNPASRTKRPPNLAWCSVVRST
jgi:hypothetical protein